MADRLLVAYKTPLQRVIETFLVLAGAYLLAVIAQHALPTLSPSYPVVVGLVVFFFLVRIAGERWAQRRGAPMLSREERSRRYLAELGPLGPQGLVWHYAPLRTQASQRKQGSKKLQRHR